ncbi:hypothetical protein [Stenotrophomonas sp. 24(2023)]|uniref:hypothetical protein n=1 Tax=Stenotrophomonas sp. 24(2023) TaxID=3068324 RepID=UPI0027E1FC08|nr:hypothetical protein [Stenotrophomonas sp. 24(2023)]WMJ70890.1 hypothetical protein Q9R17_07280 [Stenotrophomonas sp. 24(2023)]
MTQHARALQVPFHTEVDGDGVTMTVCRLDRLYYAKIKLQMKSNGATSAATILPYLIVYAAPERPNVWTIRAPSIARTGMRGTPGLIHMEIGRPGRYRIYIKEPTETFSQDEVFAIQQHALADGTNSHRDVQPIVELEVIENPNCTLSIRTIHPNDLQRTRGGGGDSIPVDTGILNFTEAHIFDDPEQALDLGNHIISFQLWADASRTYGTQHPIVQNSDFREALTTIYSEGLTAGTGAGDSAHDRTLGFGEREVQFNHQSTTGGRRRLSFLEDNGQPHNRMTADETLRRTHPATMEFLLRMMDDLDITYARVTGAWRPHIGSTRHRYASAIDLTHVRTTVIGTDGQQHTVTVHFHSGLSMDSNPTRAVPAESAAQTRTREFSLRVHRYIANARAQQTLGWLGGPWRLTYSQLDLTNVERINAVAIDTNATHTDHMHISMGTDQP